MKMTPYFKIGPFRIQLTVRDTRNRRDWEGRVVDNEKPPFFKLPRLSTVGLMRAHEFQTKSRSAGWGFWSISVEWCDTRKMFDRIDGWEVVCPSEWIV
jgi:hypothetical protein